MDFSTILFFALVVTGAIALWDRLSGAAASRRSRAGDTEPPREPVLVEYSRAFFPVILIVFALRSFIVEPFRIPSGSMLPSLYIGDFILVNKFSYGIMLPVIHKKVIDTGTPERGDVMVFRYPEDPTVNYIKRVVGLPGDRIRYENKRLFINDQLIETRPATAENDANPSFPINGVRLEETIGEHVHDIFLDSNRGARPLEYTVPEGYYFVMGDNRDHSNDSRYWGPVPEENIVGKAFFIWFSWDSANGGGVNWQRIGDGID